MKKLALDVDMLRVESFDTGNGVRGGTVYGLSGEACPPSYLEECLPGATDNPGAYSCWQTCPGNTGAASCAGCGSAGCGTYGCNTSWDPTCSPRDASCLNECLPPTG